MVLPLVVASAATSPLWVPVATGALGAVGGFALSALTKKEASVTTSTSQQNVYHSPYENYQPSVQYAPVSSYAYQGATTIINSPNTVGSKQATAQTSNPQYDASWTTPTTTSPSNTTGSGAGSLLGNVDFTTIAIIAAVAVVGYAVFKK